jgi:predicted transcriptional regulator
VNTKLAATVIEFTAVSSVLNDRLMKQAQARYAQDKQAAEKLPAVLAVLERTGCITQQQKQAAVQMLSNHSLSLDLLVKAAENSYQFKTAAEKIGTDLGRAVSDKEAGVKSANKIRTSLNDPYVGRRTSEKKASDDAILAVMDAPVS